MPHRIIVQHSRCSEINSYSLIFFPQLKNQTYMYNMMLIVLVTM